MKTKVIGVSFTDSNKIYYFLPNDLDLEKEDKVIVETERGEQFGIVKTGLIEINPEQLFAPLKKVLKKALKEDEIKHKKNIAQAEKALIDAITIADELGLDIKILSANFTFDKKQLLFNFLSDERVDFRFLAKRLAGIYKTRIELRQIGVRDKAKEVGGQGQCGRNLCCATFLKDLNAVSINMAKNQSLSLTPQKINGSCGRLMCCLAYENDMYGRYKKGLPKMGEKVKTDEGYGKVIYIDLFERTYKVELENDSIIEIKVK